MTRVVQAFSYGYKLPRYVSHTNLVLIPKKELPRSFSDLRPISLSCFVNKVISRVIHEILVSVLLKIIFYNQASYVKGRSIIENVL